MEESKELNNKLEIKNKRFDAYLTKTIIMESRQYARKENSIKETEKQIFDREEMCEYLCKFLSSSEFENTLAVKMELEDAIKKLSAIEQSVIFLLYNEDMTQEDAGEILEIYSKTISKIKIRAVSKLRKILKGDK